MKKTFLSVISIILIITTLSACKDDSRIKNSKNVAIGVIETTGYKSKSYMHFFDENLNYLYKEKFNYASLSEPFDRSFCENGEVYTIPKGEFEKRKETYILKYDIKSGKQTLYNTHLRSMNILAVSKDYVFGVNCINGISNITRCSKTDPTDTLTKEFKAVYISDMFAVNEKLYAIITVNGENKTLFAEISIATLSIVEEYDITRYGLPCNIIEYDGKIYLANQYDDAIEGPVSTTLTVFDINKKTFEMLSLNEPAPNNMIVKDGSLFVSHFEQVTAVGNKISVVDLNTNEVKTFEFDHNVEQVSLANDSFYVLGNKCMYKYAYDGAQFKLKNKAEIPVDDSGTFYYITSFFINQ